MQKLQEDIGRLEIQLEDYKAKLLIGSEELEDDESKSLGKASDHNVSTSRFYRTSEEPDCEWLSIDGTKGTGMNEFALGNKQHDSNLLPHLDSYDELEPITSNKRRDATRCGRSCHRKEIAHLRTQIRELKDENRELRLLRDATKERLSSRISKLEERAKVLMERSKNLERRRMLDLEGFRADVTSFHQRLAAAERRQKKLAVLLRMPDDDNRDAALARHRNLEEKAAKERPEIKNQTPIVESGVDFQSCLGALSRELQELHKGLCQIESGMKTKCSSQKMKE